MCSGRNVTDHDSFTVRLRQGPSSSLINLVQFRPIDLSIVHAGDVPSLRPFLGRVEEMLSFKNCLSKFVPIPVCRLPRCENRDSHHQAPIKVDVGTFPSIETFFVFLCRTNYYRDGMIEGEEKIRIN